MVSQLPNERLQAMIIGNLEEKTALLEKKDEIREVGEDNWEGEDPEMIDMKM